MQPLQSIYMGNGDGTKESFNELIDNYEDWLGHDLWAYSLHTGNRDWADWSGSLNWLLNLTEDIHQDHQVLWSIHLIPVTQASMAEAATGAYNQSYMQAAQRLVEGSAHTGDEPIYIRTGWEFNAYWARKSASAVGQEQEYVGAYQQFVESFRAVSDRFVFEWTPNIGTDGSVDVEAAYPGDKYVDIIGMDFYWDSQSWWSTQDPVAAWNYMLTQPYGLNWLVEFAEQHGKPIGISEWGVNSNNAAPFIELAQQWFEDHNVIYQNYWESNADFAGKLSDGQYPDTADVFLNTFGTTNPDNGDVVTEGDLPDIPVMPFTSDLTEEWRFGTAGNETLYGTYYNDTIMGGGGQDTLIGGGGHDHYKNITGTENIIEHAGEGVDSVHSWAVKNVLSDNIEHLYLLGNLYTQNGIGNELDNILSGSNGNNTLTGMGGNDWITTGEGHDIIAFNKGDGHDVIMDFSISDDRLYIDGFDLSYNNLLGRLFQRGNHTTFYMDKDNAVTFLNISADEFNTRNFYFTYTPPKSDLPILPDAPEKPAESAAWTNWIGGTSSAETLKGSDINDAIGSGGNYDVLIGGLGDDHYMHLDGKEQITEQDGEGIDSIYSWAWETFLGHNLEHMYLLGDYNQSATGNELGNIITSGRGHNTLTGMGGNDWITTGDGHDTVIFANGDGHDVITDFSTLDDVLHVNGYNLSSTSILEHLYQNDHDTILYLDDANAITFLNTDVSAFSSANFYITNTLQSLHATPADDLYGMNGADVFMMLRAQSDAPNIYNFSPSHGDRLDISDYLSGFDKFASSIDDVLQIFKSGSDVIIQIDQDGTGTNHEFEKIATIKNNNDLMKLDDFINADTLII